MITLEITGLHKSYGSFDVLRNLSMSIEARRIACILGPSGCGKTTLLNILAGNLSPDGGSLDGPDPSGHPISYIFQDPRLLPWKTVYDNVDFVLADRLPASARRAIVWKQLDLVGLADFHASHVYELSGGMRQRVAIARAFAFPSDLLLMDEPFRALDLGLKLKLIKAFLRLWRVDQRTVVFVTHDIQEALLLGDDIYVLSDRPADVRAHIRPGTDQETRRLGGGSLIETEKRLYELLVGEP